ncbi:DNA-binding transcriptional regulator, MarR family [Niabella drilacis]|uniref:DNA-binding transcriptional regulator, MarR family n=2 Tax=Niabella drilacis (strain DSM 25811 / CCM 8410 / CCUG 62505 / LMG 26954 / E90) TaxID=1285928 RepID=A0A1G6XHA9_NIADE|nr:DNA-binding transcriptional regulator, MarR family [Niabella drilacis]
MVKLSRKLLLYLLNPTMPLPGGNKLNMESMSIEEKINQRQFRSSYHKLALNLIYTASNLQAFLKAGFKKEDLTVQQYNILRILRGNYPDPLSTLQIRTRMMDKMSDTSRIVDRLVLKSLVTKCTNSVDNRLVDIIITPQGLEKLALLDKTEDRIAEFFSQVTTEEAENISLMLDKLHP